MNRTVKIGIIFGLFWGVVKYGFYLYDPLYNITPSIMINIFLLLCAISFGLFDLKRRETEESNFLNDIKNGMKAGVPYTIVVAISLYLFYGVVNPEYNRHQIAEAETTMQKTLNDPIEFEKLRKSNESFEVKTKEEIFKEMQKGPQSFFNAGSTTTLSLLAMLVLSTIYSILVTIILRYVFPYQKVLK
jgi:hypothetical protein